MNSDHPSGDAVLRRVQATGRGGADAHASQNRARSNREFAPAQIAIIDDDEYIREALQELLHAKGFAVLAYGSAGRALLELATRELPDLIIFDLMMPGMDGWHFRLEQKKHPRLRDIPVIALSADASPYAKAVDADAFIEKPVDPDELDRVIRRLMLENEHRRLLTKSAELERVRALGALVASVAHEINNPLTYVFGSLELASAHAAAVGAMGDAGAHLAQELARNLADASEGAARIASAVRLLSTFSRAEANDTRNVDVVRAVQAASRIARHRVIGNTSFEEDLAPVPNVAGNEARLAQVVLNLLVNAAQAVAASERECRIRLSTRLEAGAVVIEVSDTGPGIEPELIDVIFDPFYTTKPAGQGMGLGLTISRDIIAEMGGTLTVRSVPTQGTTFTVTLRADQTALSTNPGQVAAGAASSAGARLRVLVIDDEPMIARLLKCMLPDDAVDVTLSPAHAVELATSGTYDVIVCDFYMPGMTGIEVYRAVMNLRPELRDKFVLMTGFHEHPEIDDFVRTTRVRLLQKPFTVQALHECLN